MAQKIVETIQQMLMPFLEKEGYELVDIEYVKQGNHYFLRVYVDKPGGVDIDDCSTVSEYLSKELDRYDPIPNSYFLEVSSPGAERPLKKEADYHHAIGKNVLITTYEPVDGLKEFEGELLSYKVEDGATVKVGEMEYLIPTSKIASARLSISFV